MKRILVIAGLGSLLATFGLAQSNWEETRTGRSGPYVGRSNFLFPTHGGRTHVGIFPVAHLPRNTATLLFATRFVSGHGSPRTGRGRFHLFGDPYGYSPFLPYNRFYPGQMFGWSGPTQPLYSSRQFVDEWKDRTPPYQTNSGQPALNESTVLAEGMSEEQVLQAVGSPIERVQLGQRSVWKYSGYSLLFEGGSLREIR